MSNGANDDGLTKIVAMLDSSDLSIRLRGIAQVAPRAEESFAFDALSKCLDDDDTLAIQQAAKGLILYAGDRGLLEVLQVLGGAEDTVLRSISDELFDMFNHGYPLLDHLEAVIAGQPPLLQRNAALDLLRELFDFNAQFRGPKSAPPAG